MSDWQVGDLAVCVDVDPRSWSTSHLEMLRLGASYHVAAIRADAAILGLHLAEVFNPYSFDASRFRKVVSDKREECEPEFVTLLKRFKHTVSA